MNKIIQFKLGKYVTIVINRHFSDKLSHYKNGYIDQLSNKEGIYQPLDNKALKKIRQQEYMERIEIEQYNEFLKKQREGLVDHWMRSNFNEFIRAQKFHKSHLGRFKSIFKDGFMESLGWLDLYPTLKLDRNGNLVKQTRAPFEMCTDIVIVGGGMVGASIAYHIKRLLENDIKVTIVDKDFSYGHSSTSLSLGGLKQQFSIKENIQLSKYAAGFLNNVKQELAFGSHTPDIKFNYCGFLTLANKDQLDEMRENFEILCDNDVEAKFLNKKDLQLYFPWMAADGIEAGILGMEKEGWFDHKNLLDSLHRKCSHLGTDYIVGDVIDCDIDELESGVTAHASNAKATRLTYIKVKLPSGKIYSVKCGIVVLAAGLNTPEVGKIFEIGTSDEKTNIFRHELPIHKRRHFIYKIAIQRGLGLNCPIIMNPDGVLIRREGLSSVYMCQTSPPPDLECDEKSIKSYFTSHVEPTLVNLSSSFKNCKILESQPAFVDFNEFDNNPLIGFHRGVTNLFIASGFNSSSVNALGVGNYFMEKILSRDHSIDLGKYTPDRYLSISNCDEHKIIDSCVH